MNVEFDKDLINDILICMDKIESIKHDLSKYINTFVLQIPGCEVFNSERGYARKEIMIWGEEHSTYDIVPHGGDINHKNYCRVIGNKIHFPNRHNIMDGISHYIRKNHKEMFYFSKSWSKSFSIHQINEMENINLPFEYFSWTDDDICYLRMIVE